MSLISTASLILLGHQQEARVSTINMSKGQRSDVQSDMSQRLTQGHASIYNYNHYAKRQTVERGKEPGKLLAEIPIPSLDRFCEKADGVLQSVSATKSESQPDYCPSNAPMCGVLEDILPHFSAFLAPYTARRDPWVAQRT
jgi:hypothetical protein